jgi:hypothetical protein
LTYTILFRQRQKSSGGWEKDDAAGSLSPLPPDFFTQSLRFAIKIFKFVTG